MPTVPTFASANVGTVGKNMLILYGVLADNDGPLISDLLLLPCFCSSPPTFKSICGEVKICCGECWNGYDTPLIFNDRWNFYDMLDARRQIIRLPTHAAWETVSPGNTHCRSNLWLTFLLDLCLECFFLSILTRFSDFFYAVYFPFYQRLKAGHGLYITL